MKTTFTLTLLAVACISYAQEYGTGDKTTLAEISRLPVSKGISSKELLPAAYSLKRYAPSPGNQEQQMTCASWSVSYARAIAYNYARGFTHPDSLSKYRFSHEYLYHKIKYPYDSLCLKGSSVIKALEFVKNTGIVFHQAIIGSCPKSIDRTIQTPASQYRIKADSLLSEKKRPLNDESILKIKRALKRNNPVIISLQFLRSFHYVGADGFWHPTEMAGTRDSAYHAMCIVGYDDGEGGGAFEVINSWGDRWGNKGFGWLTYEQLKKYARYAVEVIDYNANKEIITGKMELVLPDSSPMNVRLRPAGGNNAPFQPGDPVQYQVTDTFSMGVRFKVKFGLTTLGYVYLLEQLKNDSLALVYPAGTTPPLPFSAANATCTLPSKGIYSIPANKAEKFLVIFSREVLDTKRLLDHVHANKTNLYNALQQVTGVTPDNINHAFFDTQNVQFKTPKHNDHFLVLYSFNISTAL
jgi:hypothetical protein